MEDIISNHLPITLSLKQILKGGIKKIMIIKKKGIQLNEAFSAVLAVVLVAVLVIIAIFLFDLLGNTFVNTSATTVNETGAFINATGYTVDNAGACNFNTFAVTSAFNATDNTTIGLGNITAGASTGIITNATATTFDNVLLSYTYNWGGESCVATDEMITQFGTYPALIGLVGTIVFLGLVIGILVTAFIFGGRRDGV